MWIKLRNPRSDVSVESQPNANSAGKFHSSVGGVGGYQEVNGKKTPSVFPAGMLMAGLTPGRLAHGLVCFLGSSGVGLVRLFGALCIYLSH